ncbi:Uncharacterised protein [Legionella steigerwaltii]|uniref:Uncharacterized protein n=1 Tax=Legionella steigerwaltii TaxID=460 RepID=A0A378L4G4_9GAMM|nr:hypothetical protein [Legionella steigerwaltii]KTD72030.1 hypothetical protein Lstg_2731 [Legionella steigerwaltii]STY21696.1 Uncharacterised protein [Legionella steigerwaltii]
MSKNPNDVKNGLEDMKAAANFDEIYKQITEDMLQNGTWSDEEVEAMRLISEGTHDPESIRDLIELDEEANKKIADMYFMILLNTLIRSKALMPFKLPENEIKSWPDNYSRGQFAADLCNYKEQLSRSEVGKKAMKAASEYTALYESTVGPKSEDAAKESEQTAHKLAKGDSSTFDKVCDTLGFLYGVADALLPGPSGPSLQTMTSQSATMGYAAGMFANGVLELAKFALSAR